MTEYVTCPFCKTPNLLIWTDYDGRSSEECAECEECWVKFPRQESRTSLLAVIAGTHYDGPEVA